jgi:G patch domain-containing protein 1
VYLFNKDFAEHGIAPRALKVKSNYKDQSFADQKIQKKNTVEFTLEDLIRPTRNTIGVRMLKKMGWREGQGIGPKIKRRLRKIKSKMTLGIRNSISINSLSRL